MRRDKRQKEKKRKNISQLLLKSLFENIVKKHKFLNCENQPPFFSLKLYTDTK
jgi:hypothetical protein